MGLQQSCNLPAGLFDKLQQQLRRGRFLHDEGKHRSKARTVVEHDETADVTTYSGAFPRSQDVAKHHCDQDRDTDGQRRMATTV